MENVQNTQLESQYRELVKKSIGMANGSKNSNDIEQQFSNVQKQLLNIGYAQDRLDAICAEVHRKFDSQWF